MKINILGAEYSIVTASEIEEPRMKESIGICDSTTHEIILKDEIDDDVGNMETYRKKYCVMKSFTPLCLKAVLMNALLV